MSTTDNIDSTPRQYTAGRYTPGRISTLKPDEVFVFGSNLAGMHGGGAARAAVRHFGAVMGQGVGMQGQSYAIPTMHGGVDKIGDTSKNLCLAKDKAETVQEELDVHDTA